MLDIFNGRDAFKAHVQEKVEKVPIAPYKHAFSQVAGLSTVSRSKGCFSSVVQAATMHAMNSSPLLLLVLEA